MKYLSEILHSFLNLNISIFMNHEQLLQLVTNRFMDRILYYNKILFTLVVKN